MSKQTHIIRDDADRGRVVGILLGLDTSKPWEVVIGRKTKKRTLSQNSLLHKLFAEIAEFTGDSEASTKSDLKALFSPVVESKIKAGQMRPLDTSEMNTKQMTDFMDRIYVFGAELGIILPHPDDQGRAAA